MKVAFKKVPTSIYDRIIGWWTTGKYVHCELILAEYGDDHYLCASSIAGQGVRTETLTLPPSNWDFVEVNVDEAKAEQWFHQHDGEGYDYLGLLEFVFPPAKSTPKSKWFCSEAVMAAFGYSEAWRFDPNAMYDVLAFSGKVM
jgi:hypothetical protein